MSEHPYGWLSLLPPIVAIVLAMATRRVIPSLLLGILASAAVLEQGAIAPTIERFVALQLWPALVETSKLQVFAFTMLMGSMVAIVSRSGGMLGLVDTFAGLARTPRMAQFTGWLLGLFVFFDDYANTLLLGKTLQPLTDRLRVSREKLAYIVDSTAAPVAGLALVSTWVATEIAYIADGLAKVPGGAELNAAELFIDSLPYRFYVWLALLLVPLLALMGRDFGPMLAAERRARRGETDRSGAGGEATLPVDELEASPGVPTRWWNAVLPVGLTVAAVVAFLYRSGVDPEVPDQTWRDIFGNADPFGSLVWGALVGVVGAMALILPQRILSWQETLDAAWIGATKMVPALTILWLAGALSAATGNDASGDDEATAAAFAADVEWGVWSVGERAETTEDRQAGFVALQEKGFDAARLWAVARGLGLTDGQAAALLPLGTGPTPAVDPYPHRAYRLYTGEFLWGLIGERIAPAWLPTLVFILAALIAFSTGTSWGTMALLMPLAVPIALEATAGPNGIDPSHVLVMGSIGGVLAGAIFGDHCSPISDTTVLSSQASGCDHVAHVNTQMPYALLGASVAIVFGTLPLGFGVPVWILWPLQIASLVAAVRLLGKRVDEA